eukprot:8589016-Pyramimonas_sp.AAC.1
MPPRGPKRHPRCVPRKPLDANVGPSPSYNVRFFIQHIAFWAPRRSQTAQEAPKTAPKRPQKTQIGHQHSPRGRQDGSRGAEDGPREPRRRAPRALQERSKWLPRELNTVPH